MIKKLLLFITAIALSLGMSAASQGLDMKNVREEAVAQGDVMRINESSADETTSPSGDMENKGGMPGNTTDKDEKNDPPQNRKNPQEMMQSENGGGVPNLPGGFDGQMTENSNDREIHKPENFGGQPGDGENPMGGQMPGGFRGGMPNFGQQETQPMGFGGFVKTYQTPILSVILLGVAFLFVIFYKRKHY